MNEIRDANSKNKKFFFLIKKKSFKNVKWLGRKHVHQHLYLDVVATVVKFLQDFYRYFCKDFESNNNVTRKF